MWTDTFGSTQWDSRQKQYVTKWGRNGLFTPQIVVDGVSDGIGATKENINEVILKAMQLRDGMAWNLGIDRVGNELRLASEVAESDVVYDVLVVKYDPAVRLVKPEKG
jgi:hypothetical protein